MVKKINCLIFGDSIAFGKGINKNRAWSSLVAKFFDEQDSWNSFVHNLAIPGESSVELLLRFENECKSRLTHQDSERIVFVSIGLNDSKK